MCVRVRACAGASARVFACGRSCVHAFACVRVRVRGCACGCARVCLRARVRASARVSCSAAFDFINADFRCRSADATCHATPHCNDDDADVFVSAEGRCRGSCRSRNHSLGQPTGACIHACTYHRAQHALTHPRTCTHTRALSRRAQAPSLRSDTLSLGAPATLGEGAALRPAEDAEGVSCPNSPRQRAPSRTQSPRSISSTPAVY